MRQQSSMESAERGSKSSRSAIACQRRLHCYHTKTKPQSHPHLYILRQAIMLRTDEERKLMIDAILSIKLHKYIALELVSLTDQSKSAVCTFTTTSNHLTPTQTLHGGITTSCLDVVCFISALTVLNRDETAATVASSFQIHSAVSGTGKRIEFTGRAVKRTKALLFCESTATCDGKVLAQGVLTKAIMKIPPTKL